MTSKRSLTDELQSMMREQSLHAPEPSSTIEAVLAQTVARAVDPVDGAAPVRTIAVARHRRWRQPRLLAAAAVTGLVVAGGIAGATSGLFDRTSSDLKSSAGGTTERNSDSAGSVSEGAADGGQGAFGVPRVSSSAADAASVPPCLAGELSASLGKETSTGASARRVVIVLRSVAGQPCSLLGYPSVIVQTSDLVGLKASPAPIIPVPGPTTSFGAQVSGPALGAVVLMPGGSATAVLDLRAGSQFNGGSAGCVAATGLTVSIGGDVIATLPFTRMVCSAQVHPFVPGTPGG